MTDASAVKHQQLRVLEAVVRRRSFTLAGKELKMSQPAISQHMRALETACGVRLVERVGHSVVPTPAGEALYNAVRHLVRVERDVQAVVAGLGEGAHASLTVGANTTGGMYLAPRLIRYFRRLHPRVEVRLSIADTPTILNRILDRSVDVAVVGGPIDPKRFDVRTLCPDELVPVSAPDHPLARRTQVDIRDLADAALIVPATGSTTRAFILARFRDEHVQPHIAMEFDATENIKKAVEAGLGVGVISRWAVRRELDIGALTALTVAGFPLVREYQMVGRRGVAGSPSVERFMEVAAELREELALGPPQDAPGAMGEPANRARRRPTTKANTAS